MGVRQDGSCIPATYLMEVKHWGLEKSNPMILATIPSAAIVTYCNQNLRKEIPISLTGSISNN